MLKNFFYLRMGDDALEYATQHATLRAAVAEYTNTARELDRYGQRIEASVHVASSLASVGEYPDYVLSLGPRGGVRVDRA